MTPLPERRSLGVMLPAVVAIPLAIAPSFGLLFGLSWMPTPRAPHKLGLSPPAISSRV